MGGPASAIKRRLFELARSMEFLDPVTGCGPPSERALSGLLALYGQQGLIDWRQVPVCRPETLDPAGNLGTFIRSSGSYVTEYPLLHHDNSQERMWGWMAADVMYIPGSSGSLVMFENKVGSDFHYEADPATSQLARQLEYLSDVRKRYERAVLILLTGREFVEANWYKTELAEALNYGSRSTMIGGFLVFWEDVFRAKRAG